MNEVGVLLRYLGPGIVFLVEMAFFCWCSRGFNRVDDFAKNTLLGLDLGLLVGIAAGCGIIISIIYHLFTWTIGCRYFKTMNHRNTIELLRRTGLLVLRCEHLRNDNIVHERCPGNDCLSGKGAWRIYVMILNMKKHCPNWKGPSELLENLVNRMHAAGTIFVGSLMAMICAIGDWQFSGFRYFSFYAECAFVVIVGATIVFMLNFLNMVGHSRSVTRNTILFLMTKEHTENVPLVISVNPMDCKLRHCSPEISSRGMADAILEKGQGD